MKAAISVDPQLMNEADRVAREIGVSRSRLFSLALQQYLRTRGHDNVLEQLNRVYGSQPDVSDRKLAEQLKAKFRPTIEDRW